VPEEVRDEFLRGCEIKRQMQEIRRSPEEIIEGVVNGLSELGCGRNVGDGSLVPHSCNCEKPSPCSEKSLSYVLLRRLFDDIYYAIEELASKYPNEVIAPFKVKQINEVLEEIRKNVDDEGILSYLRLIEEPGITEENGSTIIKGLTYSDVLLMMKWYKVLPR
jgi:predicted metal-binding transcription factor (methanogenesis marker protein 9)